MLFTFLKVFKQNITADYFPKNTFKLILTVNNSLLFVPMFSLSNNKARQSKCFENTKDGLSLKRERHT